MTPVKSYNNEADKENHDLISLKDDYSQNEFILIGTRKEKEYLTKYNECVNNSISSNIENIKNNLTQDSEQIQKAVSYISNKLNKTGEGTQNGSEIGDIFSVLTNSMTNDAKQV